MLESLEVFVTIFFIDFLRYFISAGVAYLVFWVIWKKYWRHRIIQNKLPKLKKMWFEFRYSMSTLVIFSLHSILIFQLDKAGLTTIYGEVSEYGWLYLFFSFGLMLVIHDAYFYWTHRWMHHPKIFKHVHLVHHKSTNPSPWAAYSFHPWEAMIQAGVYYIFILLFPVHPIALLAFIFYMIIRNVIGHLGIEIMPRWFMKSKLINWHTTTTHHDMHHKWFNSNYGLYFTWWDNWFGTTHKAYKKTFEEVTNREKIEATPSPKTSPTPKAPVTELV